MGFISLLLPKEPKFFELFRQVTTFLREGAELFVKLTEATTPEARKQLAREIKTVEHNNDELTHAIFDELHNTFITPIDREDIHLLASSLDDILDYIHSTADRMVVYNVGAISDEMKGLARILKSTVESVSGVVANLQSVKGRESIQNFMREIHTKENEGDALYSRAMGHLFNNGTSVIDVIKWKDIYLGVEQAIDRCEHVANVTEGIAIKHS
jgi:predicted phosphate transport protein (TIGR00153 family)